MKSRKSSEVILELGLFRFSTFTFHPICHLDGFPSFAGSTFLRTQLFNLLFCAKGFNSTQSEPDGPGLRFGSDTRAHCLNTGQPSSRCLFLNRVAVHCYVAATKPCFKAKLGYHKIQVAARRPGDGMAGVDGGSGPAPATRWNHGKIFNFLFCRKV